MLSPRRIFISYRREDGEADATRIKLRLDREFGPENVFVDTDIEKGVEFRDRLIVELADCEFVIVVIGPRWLEILKERLVRKEPDYVRLEVSEALRQAEFVIPILLGDADIPSRNSLPTNLRNLPGRNALKFHPAGDTALDKLVDAIRNPVALYDQEKRTEKFRMQSIVRHAEDNQDRIAQKLAKFAKVDRLDEGAELYSHEGPNHRKFLFFIFSGCVHLTDQGDLNFRAEQGEMMGEFPMLLGSINYSVRATATCETVYARVSPAKFCEAADAYPELWKSMARMLAERLRISNVGRVRPKPSSHDP